ncbi:MAG: GNAT family N-acetyltransferase [Planctomycetes bacterium]|nr:GNAT family N-acetyltransferase [Planctomycetota bacterium]
MSTPSSSPSPSPSPSRSPSASAHEDLFRDPGTTGLEGVVVRDLAPADLESVVRIDARASGRRRREYYERKLAEVTRDTGIRISLAAECGGTFAGFLLGRLYYGEFGLPEPTAIIDSIGVDPDLRGKSVGRALLAQLETNLRAIGIDTIRTEVEWNHLDLLGFLGAHGFAPAPVLCLAKKLG